MKSCLGILLVFFTFVAVIGGGALIWYLSETAEFSRKDVTATSSSSSFAPPPRAVPIPATPPRAVPVAPAPRPVAPKPAAPQMPPKPSSPFGSTEPPR